MKRIHLFEFNELNWFPKTWRNLFTDFLSYFESVEKIYTPVANLLTPIIEKSEKFSIIDLCSGAGAPIFTIINAAESNIYDKIQVILTDRYPNIAAFALIAKKSKGKIKFIDKPVDATNVPAGIQGFRTFFSAFHHFKEEAALAIISDAVNKNQGIGIFEYTERNLLLRLIFYFIPLQFSLFLNTPLVRPFSWQRLLWTYLIPVVPLMFFWDGIVSCLRSYSECELNKFIKHFEKYKYSWEIGHIKSTRPFRITYVIGHPKSLTKQCT